MKIRTVLLTMAVAAWMGSAHAVPTLTLDDGAGHSVTVTDGGPGDVNTAAGGVTFNGPLGHWFINVSTGVTKPAIGSPTSPTMDLNSVDVVSPAGGTLKITFTDSGFLTPGIAGVSIGGTTDGTVVYKTFANGTLLTSQTFSGNPFAGAATALVTETPPYSLTQEVDITQPASRATHVTSFNAKIHVPDGGLTAALLGFALVAMETLRRRFVK